MKIYYERKKIKEKSLGTKTKFNSLINDKKI